MVDADQDSLSGSKKGGFRMTDVFTGRFWKETIAVAIAG